MAVKQMASMKKLQHSHGHPMYKSPEANLWQPYVYWRSLCLPGWSTLSVACRVVCPTSAGESIITVGCHFVSSRQQRSIVVGHGDTCSTEDNVGELCTAALSDTGHCCCTWNFRLHFYGNDEHRLALLWLFCYFGAIIQVVIYLVVDKLCTGTAKNRPRTLYAIS